MDGRLLGRFWPDGLAKNGQAICTKVTSACVQMDMLCRDMDSRN